MAKNRIPKSLFIAYAALIIISFISISQCDPAESINGFSTDLIHIDSPQSPSYDPSLSPSQRLMNAIKRSFNRIQHFNQSVSPQSPNSDITNYGGLYLMKYSVGTPPVSSLGLADTGSDLIWTQCQPCLKCFKQDLPIFVPNKSSTYAKVPCSAPKCSSFPLTSCSKTRSCHYNETYADGSITNGDLSTDTVTLFSTTGRNVALPNTILGCGYKNDVFSPAGESGAVGLGGGKVSLVRQLGNLAQGKFSYCLVSITSNTNSSKLNFGNDAGVSGAGTVTTPLAQKAPDTFYYLTLQGISVGNQRVEFYDTAAAAARGDGNIIIDSGTTLMMLPAGMYGRLVRVLRRVVKAKEVKDPQGILDLCYSSKVDLRVPDMTVHFKGADVKLKQENVFVRLSETLVCLAAKGVKDLAIYGSLAQVDFLVGYDLQKRMVSFKPTNCGR